MLLYCERWKSEFYLVARTMFTLPEQVFYDTCVYVDLGKSRFPTLLRAERRLNVRGVAHPIVITELLNHMYDDPSSKTFQRSRAGIGRLLDHCSFADELRLLEPFPFRLARELFEAQIDMRSLSVILHMTCVDCLQSDPRDWGPGTRQQVEGAIKLKKSIIDTHREWRDIVGDIHKQIAAGKSFPVGDSIQAQVAWMHIKSAAKRVNIPLERLDQDALIDYVTDKYAIGNQFEAQCRANMYDKKKARPNDLFDGMILYGAYFYADPGELLSTCITKEPALIEAATTFDAHRVRHIVAYGSSADLCVNRF